jgi:hypothetical protein
MKFYQERNFQTNFWKDKKKKSKISTLWNLDFHLKVDALTSILSKIRTKNEMLEKIPGIFPVPSLFEHA